MGSSVFVAACGIFNCSMQDLVPWPGIEPRPLHWERGDLTTGPTRKSLLSDFFLFFFFLKFPYFDIEEWEEGCDDTSHDNIWWKREMWRKRLRDCGKFTCYLENQQCLLWRVCKQQKSPGFSLKCILRKICLGAKDLASPLVHALDGKNSCHRNQDEDLGNHVVCSWSLMTGLLSLCQAMCGREKYITAGVRCYLGP